MKAAPTPPDLSGLLDEDTKEHIGFPEFSWLRDEAVARHGPAMSKAFDMARSFLHGNAALLEIFEDQQWCPPERRFGVSRVGDVIRYMVTANQLAADRLAVACDEINEEATAAADALAAIDTATGAT